MNDLVPTKDYPRAATADIAKGMITYLNEAFWEWQTRWEKNAKKGSEAKEFMR
jgi:hypothetical protein